MNIKERLNYITGNKGTSDTETRLNDLSSALRKHIDSILSKNHKATKPAYQQESLTEFLTNLIQGREVKNEYGTCFVVRKDHPCSSHHGRCRIGELSTLDMHAAALLANNAELRTLRCNDALFLDTETTGLSGGTGTFVFLIGLGWFEEESFVTTQIFARDFSEEKAALKVLTDTAKEKGFLVTYNGKVFDLGLLSTRFILNRLPDPLPELPHLDLLFPSRRLLRHRVENNRLSTLEREVLQFQRRGDIPASEIPSRYFAWLRTREPRLVVDIFEHNRLDVLSMAALAFHLTRMVGKEYDYKDLEPQDLVAAARFLLERGYAEKAQILLNLIPFAEHTRIAPDARKKLSLLCKRNNLWDVAVQIWESILESEPDDVFAAVELAKWYEHAKHDYKRAIQIVKRALCSPTLRISEREALVYRLRRLQHHLEHRRSP